MRGATVWCFFFFNATATTEIYTLSLHDALPISGARVAARREEAGAFPRAQRRRSDPEAARQRPDEGVPAFRRQDRKSTRLNSSHVEISYAVFCLKKKKKQRVREPLRHPNKQARL